MFQSWVKGIHRPLLVSVLALVFIGVLFIYSASYHEGGRFATKQVFWVGVGFLVLFMIPLLGYRSLLSVSYLVYLMTILLLVWVLIAGQTRLGAQRWVSFGPVAIQPSEFAKLATVMALAHFLGSHHPWEKERSVVLKALAIGGLPLLLIMKQPDLGSALLFIPMIAVLLFIWGIRYRYVIISVLLAAISAPLFWNILKEYQKKRILVFLNPQLDPLGAGYTALQSRIAVGAGGFWGKGFLAGTQSQLNFVPEHHTDFFFDCGGMGFLGGHVVNCPLWILVSVYFSNHSTNYRYSCAAIGLGSCSSSVCAGLHQHRHEYRVDAHYGTDFTACQLRRVLVSCHFYRSGPDFEYL